MPCTFTIPDFLHILHNLQKHVDLLLPSLDTFYEHFRHASGVLIQPGTRRRSVATCVRPFVAICIATY